MSESGRGWQWIGRLESELVTRLELRGCTARPVLVDTLAEQELEDEIGARGGTPRQARCAALRAMQRAVWLNIQVVHGHDAVAQGREEGAAPPVFVAEKSGSHRQRT